MKALTYLFNGWMDELYFPMMALIDYRGYRLIGMTLLPISKRSQVFGSPNAGKTVYDDKEVHKLLDILAKRLNLRAWELFSRDE